MNDQLSADLSEFSLTQGGPFFRLLVGTGLIKPAFSRPAKRAVFLSLFAWLPLFVLSAVQGSALGGFLQVPLIYDLAVTTRFLVALPLLIIAEVVIDSRANGAIKHFNNSGLVENRDLPLFTAEVNRALRLRDSLWAEGVILLLVFIGSSLIRVELPRSVSTWQVVMSETGASRSLAGWWYAAVAIPLFQFLLFRWFWRLFIWTRLLWSFSRMNLRLVPTHPDLAAGLGFLGFAQAQYGIVVFALSSLIAADLGGEILFGGASLMDFTLIIIGQTILLLFLFLGPLFVFTPKLLETKRRGVLAYGALANQYVQTFDRKWIRGERPEEEPLIGSSDIQSLADLGNSFANVRNMRLVPLDMNVVVPFVAAAVLPMAPLLLTVFPFDELVLKIFGILF